MLLKAESQGCCMHIIYLLLHPCLGPGLGRTKCLLKSASFHISPSPLSPCVHSFSPFPLLFLRAVAQPAKSIKKRRIVAWCSLPRNLSHLWKRCHLEIEDLGLVLLGTLVRTKTLSS